MITVTDPVDKWLLEKWGKFSASEIGKLMQPAEKNNPGMFSRGGWSYIWKKATEEETIMTERPELENLKPLLWGKMYEQPAFERYVSATRNTSMRYLGTSEPIFLMYNEDSGGSPDGIMGHDTTIDFGLELKCPKSSEIHRKHRRLKDQYALRDFNEIYYAQIQFLLMITKASAWDFVSYDERFKDKKKKLKIITCYPDRSYQISLDVRVTQAIKEKWILVNQEA